MDTNGADSNFNETTLRKAIINLDKKFNENQKLRIKYAEDPNKFATSETELFAALDAIQGVATQTELYPILTSKNFIELILALLVHENTDISSKVIGILQELTDIDESDDESMAQGLVDSLMKENLIDLIVSNLERLDKNNRDEAQAINTSLGIIDNILDLNAKSITNGTQKLIGWMMKTLKDNPEFNSIKLSIAELLSILLMGSVENKLHLNEAGGIDILLQQVAYYRRVAPLTGDEHEFLEQIVNCLCTAVLDCDINRESFFAEEGVDLVELILREKREAVKKSNIKLSILKLFNHVLTTDKNQDKIVTKCCERFVEILGLRLIFPFFNNPKLLFNVKIKRREYHQFIDEVEEHTSAILLALLKNSQNTEHIQRILIKFAEAKFEKFQRLTQLHDKYFKAIQISRSDNDANDQQDYSTAISSSGLFTLRTIDYAILLVCYLANRFETYDPTSGETFTNHFKKLLHERPQLRHQMRIEINRHIEDVSETSHEERDSLKFVLLNFDELARATTNQERQ